MLDVNKSDINVITRNTFSLWRGLRGGGRGMGGSSDYCYEIFVKSLRMNEISEFETLGESRGCDKQQRRPPPINSRLLLLSRASPRRRREEDMEKLGNVLSREIKARNPPRRAGEQKRANLLSASE